jgi:hypothetical protein
MDALEVVEYSQYRLVLVRAPLDGATVATHILAWDYTDGYVPGKIKYCGLWAIGPMATASTAPVYGLGAIANVQNATTKIKEIWISRGDAAGNVKRMMSIEAGDATNAAPLPLYNDDGLGIDANYSHVAASQKSAGAIAAAGISNQIGGLFRITGLGQVNISCRSFDDLNPVTMAPISATDNSLTPGRRWLRLLDKQSEVAIYTVDNGASPNSFYILSAVRYFFTKWMRER